MENRLLFEKDVIKAVDEHTNDNNQLDNDISCILEELKSPIIVDLKGSCKLGIVLLPLFAGFFT